MKRYFGAHVSAAGGLANSVAAAVALNVNTIQVHPSHRNVGTAPHLPQELRIFFLRQRMAPVLKRYSFTLFI